MSFKRGEFFKGLSPRKLQSNLRGDRSEAQILEKEGWQPLSPVLIRNFWRRRKRIFIAGSSGFTDTISLDFVSTELRNPCGTSTPPLLFEGLLARAKLL
jgi:hypothetical protein